MAILFICFTPLVSVTHTNIQNTEQTRLQQVESDDSQAEQQWHNVPLYHKARQNRDQVKILVAGTCIAALFQSTLWALTDEGNNSE